MGRGQLAVIVVASSENLQPLAKQAIAVRVHVRESVGSKPSLGAEPIRQRFGMPIVGLW